MGKFPEREGVSVLIGCEYSATERDAFRAGNRCFRSRPRCAICPLTNQM